jgi:hypothetical protein
VSALVGLGMSFAGGRVCSRGLYPIDLYFWLWYNTTVRKVEEVKAMTQVILRRGKYGELVVKTVSGTWMFSLPLATTYEEAVALLAARGLRV